MEVLFPEMWKEYERVEGNSFSVEQVHFEMAACQGISEVDRWEKSDHQPTDVKIISWIKGRITM